LFEVILCKSGKAMPYISASYRTHSLLNRIRSKIINIPIAPTQGRTIDLAPWPSSISPNGTVTFTKTSRPESARMSKKVVKPDLVIFATGYSQKFPFLDPSYPNPMQANHRGIWASAEPTIGFIGFVRPTFGAIPPLAELQAQAWVLSLVGKLPLPSINGELNYKLPFRNIRKPYEHYVVDHETYAYQLALDMGAAPTFTEVLSFGPKTAWTWAMGSNFNTKFRLVGPWKWDGAQRVMGGELWDVVWGNWMNCFWVCRFDLPLHCYGL
jgi:dimethylaniline monooxygenase (N-oxide forming)